MHNRGYKLLFVWILLCFGRRFPPTRTNNWSRVKRLSVLNHQSGSSNYVFCSAACHLVSFFIIGQSRWNTFGRWFIRQFVQSLFHAGSANRNRSWLRYKNDYCYIINKNQNNCASFKKVSGSKGRFCAFARFIFCALHTKLTSALYFQNFWTKFVQI